MLNMKGCNSGCGLDWERKYPGEGIRVQLEAGGVRFHTSIVMGELAWHRVRYGKPGNATIVYKATMVAGIHPVRIFSDVSPVPDG